MLLWAKSISDLLGRDKHGKTLHKTTTKDVLELIKKVVLEEAERLGIGVEKIILFGSRARGDYREDSDYDILVVVKERLDWRTRKLLWRRIYRRLRPLLQTPIDLIIEDQDYYGGMVKEDLSLEAVASGEGIHVA